MSAGACVSDGEPPVHSTPEQTEVAPSRGRTEAQQMNGIIEDRTSVSSADILVGKTFFFLS